jgi:large subunit ribosomal protein L16
VSLQPKKNKYKKVFTPPLKNFIYKSNKIKFGNIGLQACESGFLSSKQIEAARVAINRKLKRKSKIWIRIFPSLPITRKPTEVRMGKGKGQVSHWVSKVSAGNILFEVYCLNKFKAVQAFLTGGAKLPIKTKIIKF